jgi:hypothetical protein
MSLRDLSVSDWAGMRDDVARRECEAMARALPHGLEFSDLKMHEYCGRTHRIARFIRSEAGDLAQFVLVPGGDVSLGFDGHDFKPSYRQTESFTRSAEHFDLGLSIHQIVDTQTSSRRTACVPPMLVEVDAREVEPRQDLDPVSEGDPMFEKFGSEHPLSRKTEHYGGVLGDHSYIVERHGDGVLRVWHRPPMTMQYLEARLNKTGMRLLTCDEWEHACGAGAATLFRWGDDTPGDFYPTDTGAEDRVLKRAWALSGGKLAYAAAPATWDLHSRPNLLGLRIANDPYKLELVSDRPRALGGDGGCNICGGAGFFLGWLPLATAFRNPYEGPIGPDKNIADDYHRVRRAISID